MTALIRKRQLIIASAAVKISVIHNSYGNGAVHRYKEEHRNAPHLHFISDVGFTAVTGNSGI